MKDKQLYKKALALAVPMMIQSGITNMVGLVDNIMVGSLGSEAFTGVSIITQLLSVFNLVIFGAFAGAGIYGAQFVGSNDREGFQNTVRMKLWVGAAWLALGLAALIFCEDFLVGLYMRGDSVEVDPVLTAELGKQYLSVMLWGLPPYIISQIYASSLRETGESVMPMVSGIVSVAVDVVLNYLLIFGKFGFPQMGVKGAALATVLARVAEMLVVVLATYIKREKHPFMLGVYSKLLVPKAFCVKLLQKSAPMLLDQLLWSTSNAMITQAYSVHGLEVVAGLNISNSICFTLNAVFISLGSATGILVGHSLGANQLKKAKKDATGLTLFTAALCIIVTLIMVSVSGVFPRLFEATDKVRDLASSFIIITAIFFPMHGSLHAIYSALRSGGKMLVTVLFNGVYAWLIVMPTAVLLCNFTSLGIMTAYVIVHSVELLKLIAGCILIKSDMWITNLTDTAPVSE